MGSFINSNLTDGETNRDFGRWSLKRGGRSGRFHCTPYCLSLSLTVFVLSFVLVDQE